MCTVHLNEHFNYRKLLRITLAPILMLVFTSIYSIVDGTFIANFAGKNAYAGVNLIWPITMIIGGIGFMLGAGGSALVSKYLGQQRKERASQVFSMVVIFTVIIGVITSFSLTFAIRPIAYAMSTLSDNVTEETIQEAIVYGRILMAGQFIFILQNVFQSFFMVAEKPRLGFIFTLAAGLTNMALDALFVAAFQWGVVGAAVATVVSYSVGGFGALIYFIVKRDSLIVLSWTKLEFKPLAKACTNGFSEFISNISAAVVSTVYNIQLLKYLGEDGVAAYGTLMYLGFIFVAIFLGYASGIAPAIAYNYGAKNHREMRNILVKSLFIVLIIGIFMVLISGITAPYLAKLFSSGDTALWELSTHAMRIYALSFILCGFSIFLSSFFTALNNGLVSGLISAIRTLVLSIGCVLLLPLAFGPDGIWMSIDFSELGSFILCFAFLLGLRKRYGYDKATAGREPPSLINE